MKLPAGPPGGHWSAAPAPPRRGAGGKVNNSRAIQRRRLEQQYGAVHKQQPAWGQADPQLFVDSDCHIQFQRRPQIFLRQRLANRLQCPVKGFPDQLRACHRRFHEPSPPRVSTYLLGNYHARPFRRATCRHDVVTARNEPPRRLLSMPHSPRRALCLLGQHKSGVRRWRCRLPARWSAGGSVHLLGSERRYNHPERPDSREPRRLVSLLPAAPIEAAADVSGQRRPGTPYGCAQASPADDAAAANRNAGCGSRPRRCMTPILAKPHREPQGLCLHELCAWGAPANQNRDRPVVPRTPLPPPTAPAPFAQTGRRRLGPGITASPFPSSPVAAPSRFHASPFCRSTSSG